MLIKTAASLSQLSLRQLRQHSFRAITCICAFTILKRYYAVKNITPLNTNLIKNNVAFYSTKPPVQVLPSFYEEVKDLPNHPEKLLIDVREPDELKEFGVIPTSINIPLGIVKQELSPHVRDEVFKNKYGREKPFQSTEIIFHCRSGKRSAIAAEQAVSLGYDNVKNYEGSWLDWAEHEGLPK